MSLRKESETNRPPITRTSPRALLAWILGWQGCESDPQGTVPLSPFGAGHNVPGNRPGTHVPSQAPLWRLPVAFFHRVRPREGHPQLTPPTSGSPFPAGGRRSLGCSGHSPVRSREAGRSTGQSLGRRVSAHGRSPLGCSCRLWAGAGKGVGEPRRASVQALEVQERQRKREPTEMTESTRAPKLFLGKGSRPRLKSQPICYILGGTAQMPF